jgi:Gpi18-like mannosyltransferase
MKFISTHQIKYPHNLIGLSILALMVSVYFSLSFRFLHDYVQYAIQWEGFLISGHPYLSPRQIFNGNSYGPLYIILAFLYQIYPTLPRLLFTLTWFILAGILLYWAYQKFPKQRNLVWLIWMFLIINPFFFSFFIFYGNNEILVSASILAGLYFLQKEKLILAGFILGLGGLFKFIPLFLVPFLFFGHRKLRWSFAITCGLTVLVGYAISWLLWQEEVLQPFAFGVNREAKFLSVFHYLESDFSLFKMWWGRFKPSSLSFPLLILSLALLAWHHYQKRIDDLLIAMVVLLLSYTFYKVNHLQFHTNILFLLVWWIIRDYDSIVKYKVNCLAISSYMLWISILQCFYVGLRFIDVDIEWMKGAVGLPTFLLSLNLVLVLLKFSRTSFQKKQDKISPQYYQESINQQLISI